MSKSNSLFKKITSLLLSLVFVLTSFAVVGFTNSTAIEAKADEGEYYFMTYFTGNNNATTTVEYNQATRFAVSYDGVHFSALDKNRPTITQQGGTLNSRDHYCFKGQDGWYYIIATDQDYSDNNWGKLCSTFVFWRSRDLINWQDETVIDIHNAAGMSSATINYAWAPQVAWDATANKYMIYYAFKDDKHSEKDYGYGCQMMYYIYATDLLDVRTWEEPKCLLDRPKAAIDGDITEENGVYYMFYKDETESNVCLATSTHMNGPYNYVAKLGTSAATGGLEGCQVYKVDNNYYLDADRFGDVSKFAIYNLGPSLAAVAAAGSSGTINVTNGSPVTTVEETQGFANLQARHGSVVHITKAQYDALLDHYTGSTEDNIRYDLSKSYNGSGWTWDSYYDTCGHKIAMNSRNTSNSYIKIPAGGGYASIRDAWLCIDQANAPEVLDFFPDDVYTVDFNFTLDMASTSSGTVFNLGHGKVNDVAGTEEDYLWINGDGEIWYNSAGIHNGGSDVKMGTTSILEGINYHFTIVSDGTRITVYKNGEQVCSAAATLDFPTSGVRIAGFGYSDVHTSTVCGTYYDIRFIDRALSVQEAQNQYKPNLAYRYNEGTTTKDSRKNVSDVTTKTQVTDYPGATNCHDVTISCMFNPGDSLAYSGDYCIYEIGAGGTDDSKTYFNLLGNGHIYYCWADGSTHHYFDVASSNVFGSALSANTWYHLTTVVHFDEINTRYLIMVYVNGTRTFSSTFSVTNFSTSYTVDKYFSQSRPVWIGGGNAHWTQNSGGYLDDLRIYGSKSIDPEALYEEYQEEYENEQYAAQAAEARTYVRANLESYDVEAETNALNTGATERKGYHYESVCTGGYSNILAQKTPSSVDQSRSTNGSTAFYGNTSFDGNSYNLFWPTDIALLYDGYHKTGMPVVLELNGTKYITTIGINQDSGKSPDWMFDHYWTGPSSNPSWYDPIWRAWPGASYAYTTTFTGDYPTTNNGGSSSVTDSNAHIGYHWGAEYDWGFTPTNGTRFFWNQCNYVGSGNTSSYYDYYDTMYARAWQTNEKTIPNCTHYTYVVNYKPVFDILKSSSPTAMPSGFSGYGIKQMYTQFIKNNESNYTEESLNQFYVAAYKLLTCNPVDYSEATYRADFPGTVTLAANEIKEAVAEFNKINLVERADFSELDTAYSNANTVIATLGTDAQAKTTSSINALKEVVDEISYEPADNDFRKNAKASLYDDDIETEAAKITAKISALDTIADLTDFDEAYENAEELLTGLKGKDPIYTKASVEALISASNAAGISGDGHANKSVADIYSANAAARKDFGSAVQTDATTFTTNINTALSNLQTGEAALKSNLEVYNEAYDKIANFDKDAYVNTNKDLTHTKENADEIVAKETVSYDGGTINVVSDLVTSGVVAAQTSVILSALSSHPKSYTVSASEGVTISANGGTYYPEQGATYGTRLTFTTASADTAWYMSYGSETASRSEQYQGYGSSFTAKCIGNMTVRAVTKSESAQNKITINRAYSDNDTTHGISSIDFAGSSYELPAAPALAYYRFTGYSYNGNSYAAGDTISGITGNITITANYTAATENAYTVKVSSTSGNGDIFNDTAKYNTKIEYSDPSAYAWVEVLAGGAEKLFYVGSDITYFVTGDITLKAITRDQYDAAEYDGVPTVKLTNAVVSGNAGEPHKLIFNGQFVNNGYELLEYGVLLGKATTGSITDADVIVENAGTHESDPGYKVLRAKSTKPVGANQFAIGINTPKTFTGEYKYRGYLMYKRGNDIITVYTDVVNGSI